MKLQEPTPSERQPTGSPTGDSLGELLRVVGPPAEISDERTARHKALARSRWQLRVKVRTRRRRLTWGLGLAATLALSVALGFQSWRMDVAAPGAEVDSTSASSALSQSPVASIEAVSGSAQAIRRDSTSQPRPLTMAETVRGGAEIETGEQSRTALRLATGHTVRLDVDTRVTLISESALLLNHGAVYVDSFHAAASSSIEIRTPLGIARDIGTRFEVRLRHGSLSVLVRDGIVNLTRENQVHEARSGAQLTVDAAGSLNRQTIPVFGDLWQWSLEIAPPFDIEGRSLSEFLSWVCRETGWHLRIEDPAIAKGTAAVTLDGSIEGLTITDALAVVLPTSGLRHRVEDGFLIVDAIEAAAR